MSQDLLSDFKAWWASDVMLPPTREKAAMIAFQAGWNAARTPDTNPVPTDTKSVPAGPDVSRLLAAAKFFHAIALQYGHGPQRLGSEFADIWGAHFDAISDAVNEPAIAEHEAARSGPDHIAPAAFGWAESGCRARAAAREMARAAVAEHGADTNQVLADTKSVPAGPDVSRLLAAAKECLRWGPESYAARADLRAAIAEHEAAQPLQSIQL